MAKQSAGMLLYRRSFGELQVFLVHPGGPLWVRKDDGAWSIPKGEFEPPEDPLAAAQRELAEETGFSVAGPFLSLGTVRQSGGKTVHAFAAEADVDPTKMISNHFSMEWPPRSGKSAEFPEVDRGDWFPVQRAATKINAAQAEFLVRLTAELQSSN